jgi:hypothetical protein
LEGGEGALIFMEALNDPIPERRMAWRKEIQKEIKDMDRCKVWDVIR